MIVLICLQSIVYANVKRLTPLNVKGIVQILADYHEKKPTQPLKAEAPAAGETLQRLSGAAAAKKTKRL